jgi:hypothetical protein
VGDADRQTYLTEAALIDRPSWDYARSTILPAIAAADGETVERIDARYAFASEAAVTATTFAARA